MYSHAGVVPAAAVFSALGGLHTRRTNSIDEARPCRLKGFASALSRPIRDYGFRPTPASTALPQFSSNSTGRRLQEAERPEAAKLRARKSNLHIGMPRARRAVKPPLHHILSRCAMTLRAQRNAPIASCPSMSRSMTHTLMRMALAS